MLREHWTVRRNIREGLTCGVCPEEWRREHQVRMLGVKADCLHTVLQRWNAKAKIWSESDQRMMIASVVQCGWRPGCVKGWHWWGRLGKAWGAQLRYLDQYFGQWSPKWGENTRGLCELVHLSVGRKYETCVSIWKYEKGLSNIWVNMVSLHVCNVIQTEVQRILSEGLRCTILNGCSYTSS